MNFYAFLTRPLLLLRAEGAATLALAVAAYTRLDANWLLFALLFLSPDLSMIGYLAGNRVGAAIYNVVHTLVAPTLLALIALVAGQPTLLALAVIWFAHIGLDRMVGYGLKEETAFGDTHLGHVGKRATVRPVQAA